MKSKTNYLIMKTTISKLAILVSVFYLSLASCSKGQDDTEKEEIEGTIDPFKLPGMWKLTSHIVAGKNMINERTDDCIRDNSIFFFLQDDLLFDNGVLKCSPIDPMISRGKYEFNTDHTQIKTTIVGVTVTYKILEISKTTFKIQNTSNKEQFVYTRSNVIVNINPNGLVGSWQMTGHMVNGVESTATQEPCVVDNITTFSSDNKMFLDEMADICNPNESKITSGTYSINTGQTNMVTNMGGVTVEWDILTLTLTTLEISSNVTKERATFVRR